MSELSAAFIEAQAEFPRIIKTAKGQQGNRNYLYADLPSIIDAVYPVLHKHGLGIRQVFDGDHIKTQLIHKSGTCVDSVLPCSQEGLNPQDFGKKVTYYRRYAIVAMLGLAPDDDDDAAGVDAPPPPTKPTPKKTAPPPSTMSDEDVKFLKALEEMKARMVAALDVIGGYQDSVAEASLRFTKLLGLSGYETPLEISGRPKRLNFFHAVEEMVEAVEAQAHEVAEAGI